MELEEFIPHVKKLEKEASADQRAFRRKLLFLAFVGYGYILSLGVVMLLLSILAVALIVVSIKTGHNVVVSLKLMIVILPLTYMLARAIFFRFGSPDGHRLRREEAPKFFAMCEELSRGLGTPPLDAIMLTSDLNASMAQYPRLGIFLGYRNVLSVGIPFLYCMGPEEVRSVIGHELGHQAGKDGKVGSFLYRTSNTWHRLVERIQQRGGSGGWLFSAFLKWFWPRFSARSFVHSRGQEYLADATAAKLTSPESTARALVTVSVEAWRFETVIAPEVKRAVLKLPEPPGDLIERKTAMLRVPPDEALLATRLQGVLDEATNYSDTHPSLRDRVASVMHCPREDVSIEMLRSRGLLPVFVRESAASTYFDGTQLEVLCRKFSEEIRENLKPHWKDIRGGVAQASERLDELETKAKGGALSTEEETERLGLLIDENGAEKLEPLLDKLIAERPEVVVAQYHKGVLELQRNDAKGVERLRGLMARNRESVVPVCDALGQYFYRLGNNEELIKIEQMAEKHEADEAAAMRRVEVITPKDKLVPPDIPADVIAAAVEKVRKIRKVAKLYLVQKIQDGTPDAKIYILGLEDRITFSSDTTSLNNERMALCQEVIEHCFSGGYLMVAIATKDNETSHITARIVAVPGSLIYKR